MRRARVKSMVTRSGPNRETRGGRPVWLTEVGMMRPGFSAWQAGRQPAARQAGSHKTRKRASIVGRSYVAQYYRRDVERQDLPHCSSIPPPSFAAAAALTYQVSTINTIKTVTAEPLANIRIETLTVVKTI